MVLTGPLWICAARFRAANLLTNLALLGGLVLTYTTLYLPVFDMVEETLNVLLLLSPFNFYSKLGLKIKQNSNLIINITQMVYLTAKIKKYKNNMQKRLFFQYKGVYYSTS